MCYWYLIYGNRSAGFRYVLCECHFVSSVTPRIFIQSDNGIQL